MTVHIKSKVHDRELYVQAQIGDTIHSKMEILPPFEHSNQWLDANIELRLKLGLLAYMMDLKAVSYQEVKDILRELT